MIFLLLIGCYLIAGTTFSVIFLLKLIERLDEDTRGSGIAFKLMIAPGCVLFWPILLHKIRIAQRK